jgi:transposase
MFNIPVKNIYLSNELVDMRKSFNTLSEYVSYNLEKDPLSGDAFVFIGKCRDRLKVLIWEDSGFWLCNKRLESGTYSKTLMESLYNGEKDSKLTKSQWHNLLEGIVVISSRKLKRYKGNGR